MGFYAYLFSFYVVLLTTAVCVNLKNLKMLALTLVVGAGIFAPVQHTDTASMWYVQCLIVEVLVATIAALLSAGHASSFVLFISMLLGVTNLMGMVVGPQPGFGPYRAIVPLLEISQIFTCIALSNPVLDIMKKEFRSAQ